MVTGAGHKLTTTVKDPVSGDPYTIETVQWDGEPLEAFISRHLTAVATLKKLLKGPLP